VPGYAPLVPGCLLRPLRDSLTCLVKRPSEPAGVAGFGRLVFGLGMFANQPAKKFGLGRRCSAPKWSIVATKSDAAERCSEEKIRARREPRPTNYRVGLLLRKG
jgi:hypothetical protein